jgi:hypothetical protein
MEHRWGKRVSVDIPILRRHHARCLAEARIVNISQSGALIRTNLPMPLLGRVDVHVKGRKASIVRRAHRTQWPRRRMVRVPAKGAEVVGPGAL